MDADERDQIAMASRLGQNTLPGIDQDDGHVRRRRPGNHVAGVLLVARRVGNDKLALVGREKAVRDVDRDSLLALGGQAVEEQREVEFAIARTLSFRIRLQRCELIVVEQLRFVQQAADQRALAVVDTAAGKEAQQRLLRVQLQVLLEVCNSWRGERRHQK